MVHCLREYANMEIAQRYTCRVHFTKETVASLKCMAIYSMSGLVRNHDYLSRAISPHPAIDQDVVEVAALRRAGFQAL